MIYVMTTGAGLVVGFAIGYLVGLRKCAHDLTALLSTLTPRAFTTSTRTHKDAGPL